MAGRPPGPGEAPPPYHAASAPPPGQYPPPPPYHAHAPPQHGYYPYPPPQPYGYGYPQQGSIHPQYMQQQYAPPPQQAARPGGPPPAVHMHNLFDGGARFDGHAQANIPPPPPGCAPNAAQMAAAQGFQVSGTQKKNDFFTGGSGDGYSWF